LAGHEVISYTRDNRELDAYGPLRRLSLAARTSWAWDTQRELSRLIARERPTIAHFVNTLPLISPAAFWTCRHHAVPVVYNVQNYRLSCPAATFLRNDAICTECPERGFARSVIHACYRGSRAASLTQTQRGEYLLFVGRLTVEKGILTLLDASSRLDDALS
jgi:glycosyltransferase involved in cell wall biosynthesis